MAIKNVFLNYINEIISKLNSRAKLEMERMKRDVGQKGLIRSYFMAIKNVFISFYCIFILPFSACCVNQVLIVVNTHSNTQNKTCRSPDYYRLQKKKILQRSIPKRALGVGLGIL